MLASVKTELLCLSTESRNLIGRIKEGRHLIDLRRAQNRQEISRIDYLHRTFGANLRALAQPDTSGAGYEDPYDGYLLDD